MSFLSTIPITVTPGNTESMTLSTSGLLTDLQGVYGSSGYFTADTSNWKSVIVNLKSTVGNQVKTLVYDIANLAPADLSLSALAREVTWECESAVIYDFDGGQIKLTKRDNSGLLSAYNFSSVAAALSYFEQTFENGGLPSAFEAYTHSGTAFTTFDASNAWVTTNYGGMSYNAVFGLDVENGVDGYVDATAATRMDLTTFSALEIKVDTSAITLGTATQFNVTVAVEGVNYSGMGADFDNLISLYSFSSGATQTITIPTANLPGVLTTASGAGGIDTGAVGKITVEITPNTPDAATAITYDNFTITKIA